jgi:hypothetical protein
MITKEQLEKKRAEYESRRQEFHKQAQAELASFNGAILALTELINTFPKEEVEDNSESST